MGRGDRAGGGSSVGVPVMAAPTSMSRSPAVRFGEGRRPESSTQVQLPEFEGPLALLLSLIEARQLDILTVPLGALADAYLDALARLEEGFGKRTHGRDAQLPARCGKVQEQRHNAAQV